MYFYYTFAIFICFIWGVTIYRFVIREKVFSPMTKRKWLIILCYVVAGFVLFNPLVRYDICKPWLPQEELSNLTKLEGVLQYTNRTENNTYYIEMENGRKRPINFVALNNVKFEEYEGEYVTVWKKGRYVYQMEVEGNIVLPINEANNEIFPFNCRGMIANLMYVWMFFLGICKTMYYL